LRIISTVPSQTELLFDLGLTDEVVGITKFCVHPTQWFKEKTRIGGTKTLNLKKIKDLKPDLVVANKEENLKEQIEAISEFAEVYVSEIKTVSDNLNLIQHLGELTGKRMTALRLKSELTTAFDSLLTITNNRAAYLIWKNPYMTVGGDTYINSIMKKCGFVNVFENSERYPETNLKELSSLNIEFLLLSSEPFPFKEKHIDEIQSVLPNTKIELVDGEAFSWYGTRLLKKVEYLNQLSFALYK